MTLGKFWDEAQGDVQGAQAPENLRPPHRLGLGFGREKWALPEVVKRVLRRKPGTAVVAVVGFHPGEEQCQGFAQSVFASPLLSFPLLFFPLLSFPLWCRGRARKAGAPLPAGVQPFNTG